MPLGGKSINRSGGETTTFGFVTTFLLLRSRTVLQYYCKVAIAGFACDFHTPGLRFESIYMRVFRQNLIGDNNGYVVISIFCFLCMCVCVCVVEW